MLNEEKKLKEKLKAEGCQILSFQSLQDPKSNKH